MSTMIISLPDTLRRFVDTQVVQGGYDDASAYMRALIRADEKRKAEDHLESLLLRGLEGEESTFTAQDWQSIRQEALAQVKKAQSSAA